MPLETASYISDLNPANPASTDDIYQGDDHLRMIKQVLKTTFPNITGPVTADQSQLNSATGTVIPVGLITAWYGSSGNIPGGWALCDGTTVPKSDGSGNITTPDLRNKVVIGAGTLVAQGTSAGASSATATTGSAGAHTHNLTVPAHSHSGSVGGTALSISHMPAHKHSNGVGNTDSSIFAYGTTSTSTTGEVQQNGSTTGTIQGYTSTEGSGQAHSHSLTIGNSTAASGTSESGGEHTHSVTVSTLPPCMGLHYIMKI